MPASEVQITDSWMRDQRSWILYSSSQRLPLRTIQLRHFQVFAMPVQPVQFTTHPVDCDTFETVTIVSDDFFALRTSDHRSTKATIVHYLLSIRFQERIGGMHEVREGPRALITSTERATVGKNELVVTTLKFFLTYKWFSHLRRTKI
jgi:hypothetical protein